MSQGCYPGCFYYTDSCFRQDCKQRAQQKPTSMPLRPVPSTLFPTLGSLQEVVDLGDSKLPITNRNELVALLLTYHNTLLHLAPKA